MVSDEKLIKQGIRYTDALFKELENRLRQGVISSDTLEAFLEKTKEYTTNNPLSSTGYDATLLKIILAETNNHKFSRPAQKELVRVTIENQVGELITNVGEDIKADVRDIVKEGYNNNLSQDEIADNISNRINVIKNTRARTIARTEIARAATVSDYIINKERGANYFVVDCRSTRCPVCKEAYCKNSEIGGDVEYDIEDVEMLPPKHPNCRCSANFFIKEGSKPKTRTGNVEPTKEQFKGNLTTSERAKYNNYKRIIDKHTKWLDENPNASLADINARKKKIAVAQEELEKLRTKALGGAATNAPVETTPKVEVKPKSEPEPKESANPFDTSKHLTREQLDKMDFKQLAEHHEAEYKGVQVYDYDDRKYHVFEQKYDNDKTLTVRFEEGAVKAYDKAGIATPNEIVHEVFKVPDALKRQTDEIWFKNTNHGIKHTYSKRGYDSLGRAVGGYNAYKVAGNGRDDPNHRIVINPKNFKGGGKGKLAYIWKRDPDNANDWKHVIHHEFTHSIDRSRESYEGIDVRPLCRKEKFRKVHKKERFFTWYSNTDISEEFAEHGGYVSRMLMNPDEQSKKIKVKLYNPEEKKLIEKQITFNEYKELYPEHYDYFTKLFKGEIPCY